MKKVLISLLVLAVAGGGAFAQGWTFNGLMSGGMGLFIDDDDSDASLTPLTHDGANVNFRTQLNARFVNEDDNAGLHFQIRGDGAQGTYGPGAYFDFAYGWLTFADDLVTVYGGRIFPAQFNALDRMQGFRHQGAENGLLTVIRPMDGLSLGFSAAADGFLEVADQYQARFSFYIRFDDPNGDFAFVAGIQGTNDVGSGMNMAEWLAALEDNDNGNGNGNGPGARGQWSNAYLSFAWTADEEMHLAFTARFRALEEFNDFGVMNFYATFGHTGLVDNMDIRAGASFGMSMNDAHDDPHVWIWGSIAYELNDRVIPRLDLHYVMGGRWGSFDNLHHWRARDGHTWNSDDMFLQIRPAVQLRATAASFLEIGCIFHIDLGDNRTWGGNWSDSGWVAGLYAMMRISF